MSFKISPKELFFKFVSVFFQNVIMSFLVFRLFVADDILAEKGFPASFNAMIDGTAARPFVLRTLVPSTIRFIRDLLPGTLKDNIKAYFAPKMWYPFYLKTDRAVDYLIALIIIFLLFFGFSLVLKSIAKHFYRDEPFLQHISFFAGMLIIPLCFNYGHFVYDAGTLCLFALGVLLVIKERVLLMLLFFPLLVLNKETSVLLILIFIAFQYKKMPVVKMTVISSIMGIVWLVIRAYILKIYANNPGSVAEFHLFDHNLVLFYSKPGVALYFLVAVAVIGSLIFSDWKSKNPFLRKGFLIILLPLFTLSLFFGYMDELRQFYEAAPFAALLMAPTIAKIYQIPRRNTEAKI